MAEWLAGGPLAGGLYAALAVVVGGLSLGLLWSACMLRRGAPKPKPPEGNDRIR
jgi:hypothetical protein